MGYLVLLLAIVLFYQNGEVTGLTCLECDGEPGSDCWNGIKGTGVQTVTQSPLNSGEACLVCVKAYSSSVISRTCRGFYTPDVCLEGSYIYNGIPFTQVCACSGSNECNSWSGTDGPTSKSNAGTVVSVATLLCAAIFGSILKQF